MTANQIAYWTLQETQRANRAKEEENVRHNKADESVRLTGALNNPFSLGAHFAQNENSFGKGISNQISSIWRGITQPKIIGGTLHGKRSRN